MSEENLEVKKEKKLKQLPSLGALLKKTTEVYKTVFFRMLGIVAFPYVLVLLVGGVAFAVKMIDSTVVGMIAGIISIALIFAYIYFTVASQVAVVILTKSYKSEMNVMEAYKKSFSKVMPALLASVLAGILVVVGLVFFVIPGIILSVWFVFVLYVVVDDNLGGIKALARSKEYVKGVFWGILGRISFLILVVIIISVAFYIPVSIFEGTSLEVVFEVLTNIVSILYTPFFVIFMYLLYRNVKSETERLAK